MYMVQYVIIATIVGLIISWAWYRFLFPQAAGDMSGVPEFGGQSGFKGTIITAISLILLSAAIGIFIQNRNVADTMDILKLGIKIWAGFLLPIVLVAWAQTRAGLNTLIATTGFWLAIAFECAILAAWLLLP